MFEIVMVVCFAYAGFCWLLPEAAETEQAEEEREAPARRDEPRRSAGERRLRRGRTLDAPVAGCGCGAAGPRRWRW
jgi:hypothetical protein